MTKPPVALVLLALSLCAAPASAGPDSLEAYSWLIGVWTGKGTSPEGGEVTEEYAYEWTQNRKFMKTTYVARAGEKVVWTDVGMVAIDPATGSLFGFNFGMDGSIGWGQSVGETSAESFLMEGNVVGPDLTPAFRFRMKRVGEDAIELTLESKQGDAWVPQAPQTYHRKEKPEIAPYTEPAVETPPEAIARLEPFVGSWRLHRATNDEVTRRIDVSFEWRLNRTFLRRTQVVTDGAGDSRETVEWIGWDPQAKTISTFAFLADGTWARATASFAEGILATESNGSQARRATYRLDAEGRLVMSLEDGTIVYTLDPSPARK